MVLQLFTFDFYCFGIKVSTKNRFLLFLCVSYVYIFLLFLTACLCLYTSQILVWNKTSFFFTIYSAKFRIQHPTNEAKLIHKMRQTNLQHNNFYKCFMFSKIFLALNSSVNLFTAQVQHETMKKQFFCKT